MIALLGRDPGSTDGVRDYCQRLKEALALLGQDLEITRVPWADRGWIPALWWAWRAARAWHGQWVLVQYTAFSWSRSGLPLQVLVLAAILQSRGVRLAVVYHDSLPHRSPGAFGRLRGWAQRFVMRGLYRLCDRAVLTVPLEAAVWLPHPRKASTIPVGSNTAPSNARPRPRRPNRAVRVVAVFGVTGGGHAGTEVRQISQALRFARASVPQITVTFLGCGTAEAESEIRAQLQDVPVNVLGVQPAERIQRILEDSDILLFVRGAVASGRTTAVAGIAAGTPVLGFSGPTTGPPITEAGVRLVPAGRADLLGPVIVEVLENDELWSDLHERNREAMHHHFSWTAIAQRLQDALGN